MDRETRKRLRAEAQRANAEAHKKLAAAAWTDNGYPADDGATDLAAQADQKKAERAKRTAAGPAGRVGSQRTVPQSSQKPAAPKASEKKA